MSFQLEKDVDFAWVKGDFGNGLEEYKVTHYPITMIIELMKKHGHRDPDKEYVKNVYDFTDTEALALRKESICRVLLDWKPGVILDKEGKPIGCGQKEKEQLVIDSPARVEFILIEGGKNSNFCPDMEQAAGKSERPSNLENGAAEKKSNSQTVESVSE